MRIVLFSSLLLFVCQGFAQNSQGDAIPFIYATYGLSVPGGDLEERYGLYSDIGAGLGYKTSSNWIVGIEAVYLFSNNVKEDPLLGISNADGSITNMYGEAAQIYMRMSGTHMKVNLGKVIPVLANNKNSGIYLRAGVGFLQHKIFYSNTGNNTPQILGSYTKGYDRLCNGFALSEFVGWQQFSSEKSYHFFAGVEFTQGFTQNQRQWDFATNQKIAEARLDLSYTFRLGVLILLKSRPASDYYYF